MRAFVVSAKSEETIWKSDFEEDCERNNLNLAIKPPSPFKAMTFEEMYLQNVFLCRQNLRGKGRERLLHHHRCETIRVDQVTVRECPHKW